MPENPSQADAEYRIRSARRRGRFAPGVPREIAEAWLRDPEALRAQLPAADEERPARSGPVDSGLGRVFAKSAAIGGLRPVPLRSLPFVGVRRRAALAFEIGLRLETQGVPAARPLALIEDLDESLSIWRFIDAPDLRAFLVERLGPGCGADRVEEKRRALASLAETVAALHSAGVRQRDLKAPNILMPPASGSARNESREESGPSRPRATLVDIEGMSHLSPLLDRRGRVRDLARLWVSLRAEEIVALGVTSDDWSSLLARYLERRAEPVESAERWRDETTAWAEKKERRNERRGKPAW